MWSYPLVAITTRSALARGSSTCQGPSYGLNNRVGELFSLDRQSFFGSKPRGPNPEHRRRDAMKASERPGNS